MRILMVASEMHPFAKTGGLADVVGALPRALATLGHTVDVVLPRYRGVAAGETASPLAVRLGAVTVETMASEVTDGPTRVILVDHPPSFDREFLYGPSSGDYEDNAARFALLARAALAWAARQGQRYDVVHGHDWQAGLVPVLLATEHADDVQLGHLPTVFTIHNLAYQGIFDASWAERLGLPPRALGTDAMEYWGRLSYLKGGIAFSRVITTVSPRYAAEIQTPEFGFGFEGVLSGRADDLVGILNGIDYDQWNPAVDPHLPKPFDAARLDDKAASKRALLVAAGLSPTPDALARPLVGIVSRLVAQKGFDLLATLADDLGALDATFIVLGRGEAAFEAFWRDLAVAHPDRVAVRIGFDEGLAHLIEGGADIFLMPSRFEPCGLNQMYSLRYGTVPVVRATGGLYDTVEPYDPATGSGTGFVFEDYTAEALVRTLRHALRIYRESSAWRRLQLAGMARDCSWEASARDYVRVYERAAGGRTGA
ncbi:MAG: glycogen synthase GlgA [Vicinamibacterales bacterium]